MTLGTVLLIIVILLLIGAIPSWPHSKSWGYAPSGVVGVVLIVVIVLLVAGRICSMLPGLTVLETGTGWSLPALTTTSSRTGAPPAGTACAMAADEKATATAAASG